MAQGVKTSRRFSREDAIVELMGYADSVRDHLQVLQIIKRMNPEHPTINTLITEGQQLLFDIVNLQGELVDKELKKDLLDVRD